MAKVMVQIQLILKMNKMKFFVTICLLIFSTQIGLCCTCIGAITIKNEYKRSDAILKGKLLSKKTITITDRVRTEFNIQMVEYKFQVLEIYKGKIKNKIVAITTGIGNGDCGFVFNIDEEYIIYSSYENKYFANGNIVNKFLYTDICRRTRLANDLEEIKELKKRKRSLIFQINHK